MRRANGADRPAAAGWAPLAILAAAVATAYANALGAAFQFDDWNVIVDEPRVATLAAWWASMPGIRPLLKLSYALNHALGGGAAAFHAVNVAIHAANAMLAFALLLRLARREGIDERRARAAALFGALLFALHPIQTEAVTYVSGRSTSLAAAFSLLGVVAWIEGRARSSGRLQALSAVSFAAGLLVKETAAMVPVALLLWEWGSAAPPAGRRRLPWTHLALLGAAAAAALASPTYRRLLETSLAARPVGANLRAQAEAVSYLAVRLVRVDLLNADPALPPPAAWTAAGVAEGAAIAALLALGISLLRRRPAVAFGILWFFLWLAPTNSLIPRLDVVNERQIYLALLGPAWLVALAAGGLATRRRGLAVAAALVLTVALGLATHLRNRVYAGEIAFWEDVARKSPGNGRAFNNLGYAYALAARDDAAEAAFREALAIDPGDVRAAVNLRLLREGALTGRRDRP